MSARLRIQWAGRDGPEPGVPNDEPWEVVDVETGDELARFASRDEARTWVRQQKRTTLTSTPGSAKP